MALKQEAAHTQHSLGPHKSEISTDTDRRYNNLHVLISHRTEIFCTCLRSFGHKSTVDARKRERESPARIIGIISMNRLN